MSSLTVAKLKRSRIVSLRARVKIKRISLRENCRIVCKPAQSSHGMNISLAVCIRPFVDTEAKGLTSKSSCSSGRNN